MKCYPCLEKNNISCDTNRIDDVLAQTGKVVLIDEFWGRKTVAAKAYLDSKGLKRDEHKFSYSKVYIYSVTKTEE